MQVIWGAGHRQRGIYFVNSKKWNFMFGPWSRLDVGLETTYEEQKLTPDLFIMVLRLGFGEKP